METIQQYQQALAACKQVYLKKAADYGTSWRVLRTISIADQIYIKAWRIRSIQENGNQQVADSIDSEFMAIVNYGIIAGIQLASPDLNKTELSLAEAEQVYDEEADKVRTLMMKKNHDYGEAWRHMSEEAFVDLILTKLLRIRQIISNEGQTLISEGVDANFQDIVNYALFALIKRGERVCSPV